MVLFILGFLRIEKMEIFALRMKQYYVADGEGIAGEC